MTAGGCIAAMAGMAMIRNTKSTVIVFMGFSSLLSLNYGIILFLRFGIGIDDASTFSYNVGKWFNECFGLRPAFGEVIGPRER